MTQWQRWRMVFVCWMLERVVVLAPDCEEGHMVLFHMHELSLDLTAKIHVDKAPREAVGQ